MKHLVKHASHNPRTPPRGATGPNQGLGLQHACSKGGQMHNTRTPVSLTLQCHASRFLLAAYDTACWCCWQAFDGGEHLVHSGMSASALYLFERLYSLAKVRRSFALCMHRISCSPLHAVHRTDTELPCTAIRSWLLPVCLLALGLCINICHVR